MTSRIGRRSKQFVLILLLNLAFSCSWADGVLDVSREKVLPADFAINNFSNPYHSAPYPAGVTGSVWHRELGHEYEVASIRLHVKVEQKPGAPPFEIRVSDTGGEQIERLAGNSPILGTGEYWTALVTGPKANIELITAGDPALIDVIVDRYAYAVSNGKPQATFGTDDKIDIKDAPPEIKDLASSVARLVIMTPGAGAFCTGFLLTHDLLLTNQHCIKDNDEARSTIAEFRFENPNPRPSQYRVLKLEAANKALDYALVRLYGAPGDKFKPVLLKPELSLEEQSNLLIIQHPAGRPKMAAIKDCRINGLLRVGVVRLDTDFGHTCDTLGGSSGSPVFHLSKKAVVGLHHLGFEEGLTEPVNQAVYLSKILADVKNCASKAYSEIAENMTQSGG